MKFFSSGCPGVMGYFTFVQVINLQVNTFFPKDLNFSEAMKSGWMADTEVSHAH